MIIFRGADGRILTAEDLSGFNGEIRWEIAGSRVVPAAAKSAHEQARRAAGTGDYKTGLALFERAASLAPEWPYPVYDMAYTFLLMKDLAKAREFYRKTLEVAPRGFFTAITALDTLEREKKGNLPAGTYLAYLSVEQASDPARKAELLGAMTTRVPGFAPAWCALASTLDTDIQKLAAIEKGLGAQPDAETKGMLRVNQALIWRKTGDRDGAIQALGELVLDPESTCTTEHWAKVGLAMIIGSEMTGPTELNREQEGGHGSERQ